MTVRCRLNFQNSFNSEPIGEKYFAFNKNFLNLYQHSTAQLLLLNIEKILKPMEFPELHFSKSFSTTKLRHLVDAMSNGHQPG